MNVPENLAEGLNLAGTGMALVFAALVVFMLILMALQKLFPGEEIEEEEFPEAAEPELVAEVIQVTETAPVVEEAPEPPAVAVEQTVGRIPGSQIAAMAVAIYLAMEQQPQPVAVVAAEPVLAQAPSSASPPSPATTPYGRSSWGRIGREAMLESQGRRAPAYGNRPQSAFNPRGSERR